MNEFWHGTGGSSWWWTGIWCGVLADVAACVTKFDELTSMRDSACWHGQSPCPGRPARRLVLSAVRPSWAESPSLWSRLRLSVAPQLRRIVDCVVRLLSYRYLPGEAGESR
jgi:hypothetical protein